MTQVLYNLKIKPEHLARKAIVYLRCRTGRKPSPDCPLGPLQRDLMEAHLSRDTAEDERQSAIADQRLTPADGITDHPSGMLTANYAPVDT